MSGNRLNIIKETESEITFLEKKPVKSSRTDRMRELKAKFERLWLIEPEKFNPFRNCMEQERFNRTWSLLTKHVDLKNKRVIDIGCGAGEMTRRLRDEQAEAEGVDIAENALKQFVKLGSQDIPLKQGALPNTTLPDRQYDVIVCTEVIAELPREDHRLFFAELARLIKLDGFLICSSAIDIDTSDGKEKLIELAQTEFVLFDDRSSYHALYLRLKRFFETPFLFIKYWKNPSLREKELAKRKGLNWLWFKLNSIPPLVWFWAIGEPLIRPIGKFLKNSPKFMLFLERICRFLYDQEGISHYLFIAKLRPLKSMDSDLMPIEKPHRKEIWN